MKGVPWGVVYSKQLIVLLTIALSSVYRKFNLDEIDGTRNRKFELFLCAFVEWFHWYQFSKWFILRALSSHCNNLSQKSWKLLIGEMKHFNLFSSFLSLGTCGIVKSAQEPERGGDMEGSDSVPLYQRVVSWWVYPSSLGGANPAYRSPGLNRCSS